MLVSTRRQLTLLWMMEGEKVILASRLRISKRVRCLGNPVIVIRFAQMSKAIDLMKNHVSRDKHCRCEWRPDFESPVR